MRLPDMILHCAGFFARKAEPDKFLGTGFIVAVHSQKIPSRRSFCVVTAKHVAVQLGPDDAFFSVTLPDGSREDHHVPAGGWFFHPTEPDRVDVAVTFLFPTSNRERMPLMGVDTDMFLAKGQLAAVDVGLGSHTATVGLFSAFWGTTKLTPIVRMGTVAMMPIDTIPHQVFGNMEAIFVEGTSFNHQSGSPVFALSDYAQKVSEEDQALRFYTRVHFLGLNQGHFQQTSAASGVNMQVVIVVPSYKILETLQHPELLQLQLILEDPNNLMPYGY